MRRLLLALSIAGTPLLSSCYEYVRTDNPTSLVGRQVQLVLTDAGTAAEAAMVGPSVEAIEGRYVALSEGTAVIAVTLTRTRSGQEVDWRGERVAVPMQHIASFLERRFSQSRTAFAGGLAAAGVIGATVALRGRGGASGSGSTPKPVGPQ